MDRYSLEDVEGMRLMLSSQYPQGCLLDMDNEEIINLYEREFVIYDE